MYPQLTFLRGFFNEFMATLFERVNLQLQPGETITDARRSQIGTVVYQQFKLKKHSDKPLFYKVFETENGKKKVASYPNWFTPIMDEIIQSELVKPPPPIEEPKPTSPPIEKRIRKRIPAKILY